MSRISLSFLMLAVVVSLTGCETLNGIGQDIENTGNNIHEVLNGDAFKK